MALMSAALIGVTLLSTSPLEGSDKPKKAKPKAVPKATTPKATTPNQVKASNDHIYKAIQVLHVARHNANSAPHTNDRFGGHRNKAVEHMGHAIKELENALKFAKAPPAKLGKVTANNMPMEHALKMANDSLGHAAAAAPIYDWHRARAIERLEYTTKELTEGIAFYAAHPTK
jgi:hypothetical protein